MELGSDRKKVTFVAGTASPQYVFARSGVKRGLDMPVYYQDLISPPLPASIDTARHAFGVVDGVAPPNKIRKRDASDTATRSSCSSSALVISVNNANMLHSNVEAMRADPDFRIQKQRLQVQQHQRQISSVCGDGFWLEPPAMKLPNRTL